MGAQLFYLTWFGWFGTNKNVKDIKTWKMNGWDKCVKVNSEDTVIYRILLLCKLCKLILY